MRNGIPADGHEMLQSVDGADGAFGFEGGKRVHLLPEADGIAEFAFGYAAQPLMVSPRTKGPPFACMDSR
jgi:hypothetical protein